MLDSRRVVRLAATAGLALVTFASEHLSTQGRRNGRSLRTEIVDGREVVEGEVLVRYRAGAGVAGRERAELQIESDEAESIGRRGARRLRSRRLATRAMLQALRANPDVEYAEPNYVIRLNTTPNEGSFQNLWGLFNTGQSINGSSGVAGADVDAPGAWQHTTGSRANVIAIVDTGIDYSHPDLAANIWTAPRPFTVTISGVTLTCAAGTHGFNAITNTCNPMDDHSHGTHVAGTVGAVGNNGAGVAGVNWVASMMGLKFLGSSGSGSTSDAIKAIEFAIQAKAQLGADANVRILNNSWGGGGYSTALANQIEAANAADMLFVAAAGNNATNNDAYPHYPSSYGNANVVSVASSTNRDQRSSFSNYGAASVDLAAPGSAILSTVPGGGYAYYNGTSMATPHVAGAAALILAACPLGTAELKATLLATVDRPAALAGLTATGGRLDVNSAIAECRASLEPPSIVVTTSTVQPGGTIQFEVRNGPGAPLDWVGLFEVGVESRGNYLQWAFLNGAQTPPATGRRNATLSFTAPQTPGTYDIRWFASGGYNVLSTSNPVTIAGQRSLRINDVSIVEGHSGTAQATFTVTVSPVNPSQTVAVQYASANGTATTTDNDYAGVSGSLTFPPGTATQTVTVAVTGDTRTEADETFVVNLLNPVNAAIGDGMGIATIVNDDAPACTTCPAITAPATVTPGATIHLQVSGGPANALDWVGLYASGTTEDRGNYLQWQFLNGTQTAPASGRSSAALTFTAPQTPGTYDIRWFANGGYTRLARSSTITAGSPSPALAINDVSVTEGNSGTATATFTVTLAPVNPSQTVTVNYVTANGSATTGDADYEAASGTLTFAPAVATQTIAITINGDTAIEPNEFFSIGLSGAANATIADASGTGTIVNDDAPPCSTCPAIVVPSTTVNPGAPVTVHLSYGPGNSLDWAGLYAAGTSEDRGNYLQWQFLNGTQNATDGRTSATLTFTAPATPGLYDIRWFANGGYTRLATSSAITVGAPAPALTINDVSITEGNSGVTTATFTVALSPANGSQTVTVAYNTVDGTASVAGGDYAASSGTLTFAPSVTTQTISVAVNGDAAVEADETFTVRLSNAVNAAIADGQGIGTILTDDAASSATIGVAATTVRAGGAIVFQMLNGPGHVMDWLGLYAVSAADRGNYLQWQFLSGTQTPPGAGMRSASGQFVAPQTPGTYNIRFFGSGGYTRLATSVAITVIP